MGATVSHPQYIHKATTKKRTLSKKHSLPAYLTHRTNSKEKFFPPPILHTKLHDLNTHIVSECTSNDGEAVYQTVPLGKNRRRVMFRKSTVDDSQLNSTGHVESKLQNSATTLSGSFSPVSEKLNTKISPASSTSSGVGLEDFDRMIDDRDISDKENRKKNGDQTPFKQSFRSSMDSGASYDDDELSPLTVSGDENYETVFEENEPKVTTKDITDVKRDDGTEVIVNDESSNDDTVTSKKSATLYNKKEKKRTSLVKKWRKARSRAISLPGTYMAELLRKSKHHCSFLYTVYIFFITVNSS